MKQLRECLRNRKGMTMVEVLMGFVVLVVFLGGLSSVIAFSSNMLYESMDLKRTQEALREQLYKKTVDFTTVTENGYTKTFQKENNCKLVMVYQNSDGEEKRVSLKNEVAIYSVECAMDSEEDDVGIMVYGFE